MRAFEAGQRMPIRNNIGALARVLEAAGMRLLVKDGRTIGIAVTDYAYAVEVPTRLVDPANGP